MTPPGPSPGITCFANHPATMPTIIHARILMPSLPSNGV